MKKTTAAIAIGLFGLIGFATGAGARHHQKPVMSAEWQASTCTWQKCRACVQAGGYCHPYSCLCE